MDAIMHACNAVSAYAACTPKNAHQDYVIIKMKIKCIPHVKKTWNDPPDCLKLSILTVGTRYLKMTGSATTQGRRTCEARRFPYW
jgi:hypothetical protein